MHEELKLSGAKDTNSFNKHFRQSILKLTALYVVILAIILLISSSVLYSIFSNKLERRFRSPNTITFEITRNNLPSPDDVREDLIDLLMRVNGFLLIVAGILSYRLAQITLEPLKKSYERERQFLSDASHELRTPLSILKTEFENELIDTRKNSQAKEKIESNLEEVNRMSNLVSDLLTITRLSETQIDANQLFENINLSQTILKTIERLKTLANENKVSVETSLPEHEIFINSHYTLIDKIFLNCLKNAIIYNKENGTVKVALTENKSEALIKIVDTGIGLSKEDSEKIFNRFYRVDDSRSRQTGGSGLGLSIVKSAIDKLGGKISLESKLGAGTTINLTIPKN